ncbi:hypothetical protein [Solibacillus sp. FSL H8-0538]|uniref:hypothetical protein n=1 Tax=Solibacillus sp. FSL H8-0538 TaxID=2921400 RepID=UPI0030F86279
MGLLYVYVCDACDTVHHCKEEILYCTEETCEELSTRVRLNAAVEIDVSLEWENATEWGTVEQTDTATLQTIYMGKKSLDVYSKPWVDEEGEIYADRLCLDSNQFHEAEHMGTFEGFHSLTL